jgi:hypothetical protein
MKRKKRNRKKKQDYRSKMAERLEERRRAQASLRGAPHPGR